MRSASDALKLLMDRAGSELTKDDLHELCTLTDVAAMQARQLSTVLDALGGLVANDTDGGWMQGRVEVSALAWHVASSADLIGALIETADRAEVLRKWGPVKAQPDEVKP